MADKIYKEDMKFVGFMIKDAPHVTIGLSTEAYHYLEDKKTWTSKENIVLKITGSSSPWYLS